MAFTINTNIASMQAQEYLRVTGDFQNKTINRVTSGLRIVNSGDDAAGLAIANGYRSDQAVLAQGIRNANDGLATLQTIDSGMSNINKLLDRARTLAAQSASDTFIGDRSTLNNEFQNILVEIDRQAQAIGLVAGGDFAKSLNVFIGGGRSVSGGTSAAVNGSVNVNLSAVLVDRTSLGLASNGVAGTRDLRAGTNVLDLAKADGAASAATFRFRGAGFTSTPVDVDVDLTSGVNSEADVVAKLNTAIQTAAATNSSFASAGIKATIDSSGHLVFTSSSAVQVSAADNASQILFKGAGDATASYSTGTHKANMGFTTIAVPAAGTTTQKITVDFRNASGTVDSVSHTFSVSSAGSAIDVDTAISQLNAVLAAKVGNDIYAVRTTDGSAIDFISAKGTSFQVNIDATQNNNAGAITAVATGGNGGTQTVTASASTGTGSVVDISTSANAVSAVTSIEQAVKMLGSNQATVGKAQNQIGYAISLASTQLTNLAAAESRIRDADLAQEAANLTKAQILQQAGIAALAQANSAPQAVLSLLRG
jgi:flagellin